MKAFVTIIDDNGKVICKDQVLKPIREEVIERPNYPTIKEARFNFAVKQLADFQTLEVEE